MRSRTNRINVWLSDKELADLNEKVSRVRGSRERFIRQCINGAAIREAPSVDVARLIHEVRRVGANLNRILIIANARGLLEVPELRKAMERNRELEVRIVDAYTKRLTARSTAQPLGHAVPYINLYWNSSSNSV